MMRLTFKFNAMLSLLLALALLLAACSSGGSPERENPTNSEGGDDKPVELVFAFLNVASIFKDLQKVEDEINKITQEKINAKIKLMPIDVAAWTQQTNLILAGSEPLDLIVSSATLNYSSQVAKGQIIALDDLIEQYAPDIKHTMPAEILAGAKLNGVTYGIPSVRDFATDYGYIARKDILDKHNIDLSTVKTFEDLTAIFQILKEKEPDMYPIVQRSQTVTIVTDMFTGYIDGLGNNIGVLNYDDDSTQLFNLFESDIYRKYSELAHEWYKKGFVPPDASTSQESNTAMMRANKAIGYLSNFKPGFENQEKVANGMEMVAVRITEPVSSSSTAASFMISIAKNSKNPEKAMEMINLLYTDKDIVNLLDNGIEGIHYVQAGDGTIKLPDGVTEQTYLATQWMIGNNALAYPWQGTAPDIWDQMKAFNESAKLSKAIGFVFDTTNVKTEVAAVQNVLDEYRPGIESGTLDPSTIADFNKKLKDAGLDTMIAEKQKQLDAWLQTQ